MLAPLESLFPQEATDRGVIGAAEGLAGGTERRTSLQALGLGLLILIIAVIGLAAVVASATRSALALLS
jgi:hypothetical protein